MATLTTAGRTLAALTFLAGATGCFRPTPLVDERALQLWQRRAGSSAAGSSAAQPLTLDEEQALTLALRRSPSLRAGRDQASLASARVEEERQLRNPELRLQNVDVDKLVDRELGFDVGVRLHVPRPWTHDARVRRAELSRDGAQAEAADLEHRIRARVRKLFARLTMLERTATELEVTMLACARIRASRPVGERQEDGAATSLDGSLTRLRQTELSDLSQELREDATRTTEALRRVIGLDPDQPVVFRATAGSLAAEAPILDEASLIRRALTGRRDLRRVASQVAMAEADLYLARSQRWPWLTFFDLYYKFRPALHPSNFQFGLGVDLPVFSWNRGGIAVRDAELALRRGREQALVLETTQQVHEAVVRVRETRARVETLKRTLLPVLETAAAAANEAASRSMVDPLRAINVAWRVIRGKHHYHQALLSHREALIDLELAVGD